MATLGPWSPFMWVSAIGLLVTGSRLSDWFSTCRTKRQQSYMVGFKATTWMSSQTLWRSWRASPVMLPLLKNSLAEMAWTSSFSLWKRITSEYHRETEPWMPSQAFPALPSFLAPHRYILFCWACCCPCTGLASSFMPPIFCHRDFLWDALVLPGQQIASHSFHVQGKRVLLQNQSWICKRWLDWCLLGSYTL